MPLPSWKRKSKQFHYRFLRYRPVLICMMPSFLGPSSMNMDGTIRARYVSHYKEERLGRKLCMADHNHYPIWIQGSSTQHTTHEFLYSVHHYTPHTLTPITYTTTNWTYITYRVYTQTPMAYTTPMSYHACTPTPMSYTPTPIFIAHSNV